MHRIDTEIHAWYYYFPSASWWHGLWFLPFSYACICYRGPLVHYVHVGYVLLVILVCAYALLHLYLSKKIPKNLFKILKNIAQYPSRPLYVVFNLSDHPILLQSQCIQDIDEPVCALHWYQFDEAELLELLPQAIVDLPARHQVLTLLWRHMSHLRFRGIIIQISSTQLLSRPPFSTLRTLLKIFRKKGLRPTLPYQIIIYNGADPNAQDAIIFTPDAHAAQHPKLWPQLRIFFQNIIDTFRALKNISNNTQATHLDMLMDPTEYLLEVIGKNNALRCTAIHLLGFGMHSTHTQQHPILIPYRRKIWPKVLRATVLATMLACGMMLLYTQYMAQKTLQSNQKALQETQLTVLTAQLLAYMRNTDSRWHNFIPAATEEVPALTHPHLALQLFQKLPLDTQTQLIRTQLHASPPCKNPMEVHAYYAQASELLCTLRGTPDASCTTATESLLIRDWIAQTLQLLESGILPIDTQTHIDPAIRVNQLDYILKHPHIIGEHIHQRLGLIESVLRKHEDAVLEKQLLEIKELVEMFKNSGSYQTIHYILQRYAHDTPIPIPDITALNAVDARLMLQLHPLEKITQQSPPILQDLVHHWDTIYHSYLPLQGCFPLQQQSSQDCDVTQFIAFFQPQIGIFDSLWSQYFQEYTTISAQEEPFFHPDIAPYITPELIERYMQVRIIQSVFFSSGQAAILLRLRPEISHKDMHVDLKLARKTYSIDSNMHTEIPITWSYVDDTILSFYFKSPTEEQIIEYRGHWALLKLLQKHLIPGAQHNTLEINALHQTLRLNPIGCAYLAPWYNHLFDSFHLPEKILLSAPPQAQLAPDAQQQFSPTPQQQLSPAPPIQRSSRSTVLQLEDDGLIIENDSPQ